MIRELSQDRCTSRRSLRAEMQRLLPKRIAKEWSCFAPSKGAAQACMISPQTDIDTQQNEERRASSYSASSSAPDPMQSRLLQFISVYPIGSHASEYTPGTLLASPSKLCDDHCILAQFFLLAWSNVKRLGRHMQHTAGGKQCSKP